MSPGWVQTQREWPVLADFVQGVSPAGNNRDEMRFMLSYEGPLPASTQKNTRAKEKQAIRRELSFQLDQLWSIEPPLASRRKHIDEFQVGILRDGHLRASPPNKKASPYGHLRFELKGFCFVPLITAQNNLQCHVDIVLFRDGDPGHVMKGIGGDLDNRMKTLFDALRMPHTEGELGKDKSNSPEPFFCLLEDDRLITRLSIDTRRRLRRKKGDSVNNVQATIDVTVVARKITDANHDYIY